MTASAATASLRRRARPLTHGTAAAIAALGCGVLAARPALLASDAHPATTLVVLFGALLAVGVTIPLRRDHGCDTRVFVATLLIGVLAFGAGRLLIGGHAPARVALPVVLANTLAAVAEEAWFRRLCYGLLAPAGPAAAIAGSTALFAAVHVSTYGFWVLPVDLAAGALFGWQRAITGSWTASAATHALANLFVVL